MVVSSVKLHEIPPELIFNADEFMVNSNFKDMIIVPRDSNWAYEQKMSTNQHITGIIAFNAVGHSATPFINLNLKRFPPELSELVKQGFIWIAGTEKGWMTRTVWANYVDHLIKFINELRSKMNFNNQRGVLFVDSHTSRENPDALINLKNNQIDVVSFPAYTTHLLQPFDIGIASPFKRALKKYFKKYKNVKWTTINGENLSDTQITRRSLVMAVIDAWKSTYTLSNCKNAFKESGIYPIDKFKVLSNSKVSKNETDTEKVLMEKNSKKVKISGTVITSDIFLANLKESRQNSQKKSQQKSDHKKTIKNKPPITFHPKKSAFTNNLNSILPKFIGSNQQSSTGSILVKGETSTISSKIRKRKLDEI